MPSSGAQRALVGRAALLGAELVGRAEQQLVAQRGPVARARGLSRRERRAVRAEEASRHIVGRAHVGVARHGAAHRAGRRSRQPPQQRATSCSAGAALERVPLLVVERGGRGQIRDVVKKGQCATGNHDR